MGLGGVGGQGVVGGGRRSGGGGGGKAELVTALQSPDLISHVSAANVS